MRFPIEGHRFLGFFPPYRKLDVLEDPYQIPRSPLPNRGAALLWNLRAGEISSGISAVQGRPPGVALFIILPPTKDLGKRDAVLRLMGSCRPHSVIPHVQELDPQELVPVLRRFPTQFAVEVTEYLVWRGVDVDLDTRRLLRKTLDLAGDLRTVSGLARSLYMSRRALGRRFMTRGLPVPSHWLHFGRVLRGAIHLQNPRTTLFGISCDLGYSDGFAFSNQLKRLTGLRPSIMRDCFGWEWIVEAWLFTEHQLGSLSPGLRKKLFPEPPSLAIRREIAMGGSPSGTRHAEMRVAEEGPDPA